eukprot:1802691-Rhodomonas_salina.3
MLTGRVCHRRLFRLGSARCLCSKPDVRALRQDLTAANLCRSIAAIEWNRSGWEVRSAASSV